MLINYCCHKGNSLTPSQKKIVLTGGWFTSSCFLLFTCIFENVYSKGEEPKGSVMVLRTYCAERTERNELLV